MYEIGQERSAMIFFGSLFFSLFLSHERKKMNGRVAHAERKKERERSRLSCTACVVKCAAKLIYALESSERRWNAVIRQMLSDTR